MLPLGNPESSIKWVPQKWEVKFLLFQETACSQKTLSGPELLLESCFSEGKMIIKTITPAPSPPPH